MPRRAQLFLACVLFIGLAVAGFTLPVPSPAELRAWAAGAGAATPMLFLLVYAMFTVAPIPRTVFSLAAGLLLGHWLGIVIAMLATAISAALGFLLARLLGRNLVARHLHRGAVRTVHDRLTGGGVLAVTSLRLIPVIPFAPLSYCCGMSAIRLPPYLAGTVLGSFPGTAAVVLLGDALTGSTPPVLLACYGTFAALGAFGLYRVVRRATPPALCAATEVSAATADSPSPTKKRELATCQAAAEDSGTSPATLD
ncbi:TVP38/TMEM64 family protein [Amycolatopsis marina]|uniref:TVP38/TMEM64 family protein n=1 Tax=Amycolatopsis marina TaxID=490629 RepID=UPI003CCC2855